MRRSGGVTAFAALTGSLLAALVLTGCSQGGNESTIDITGTPPLTPAPSGVPTATTPAPTEGLDPQVTATIATGLEAPWGLDFFANGDAIVTERDTRRVLRIVGPDHEVKVLGTLDAAAPEGEGGLLGVALSPDFGQDHLVYFYLTTVTDNRVVRTTLKKGALGELQVLLDGIPDGLIHDGGRLAFGPDGFLYVSTGESGRPGLAQNRASLGGKILRLRPDGRPAPGNPFDTEVLTYGHRNVQGLAFDDQGILWASEFGQDRFDELNRIRPGDNYGWPQVEGKGTTADDAAGYTDPQQVWEPDDASPSGLAYADGYLWMAALNGERLWRVELKGKKAVDPQPFFVGDYGRMRTIAVAPDGTLWLTTSNRDGRGEPRPGDDRILQVTP